MTHIRTIRGPMRRARKVRADDDQFKTTYDYMETNKWRVGHVIRQRSTRKPWVGEHSYRLIKRYDYNPYGTKTMLTWEGHCCLCGDRFTCQSPSTVGRLYRTCRKHRYLGHMNRKKARELVVMPEAFRRALEEWKNELPAVRANEHSIRTDDSQSDGLARD